MLKSKWTIFNPQTYIKKNNKGDDKMGLDMYLYGKKDNYNLTDYNIGKISIQVEVGYWRKANAIHQWFIDNVQQGVDNCATYAVGKEELEELKSLCEEVINKPEIANEKLPTQSGFFFGSTEYDEFYFNDLQDTIEIIDKCLALDYDYFEYCSSW